MPHGPIPTETRERLLLAALSVGIVLCVAVAFWPGLANDWLNWDDRLNFVENPMYRGLSAETIAWAWTTFLVGVYQPLSWMLLGAQYALFGMDPWGYHLTSLLLHAAVAMVLFLVCVEAGALSRPAEMPGSRRRRIFATAVVVAVVMVHPMRVEVVTWISCQPYLPCALFYLLALWAYLRAHPPGGRMRPGWCAAAFGFAACALLSKAAATSLPVILLAMDVWVLRRLPSAPWTWYRGSSGVLAEKLAFAALAAPFAVAAIAAKLDVSMQEALGSSRLSAASLHQLSHSFAFYAAKTLVPVDLSPFYTAEAPAIGGSMLFAAAPFLVLGLGTMLLLGWRSPLVGIAIAYIAALTPNIGLVRITTQIAADRYVFIPLLVATVMGFAVPWGVRAASWQGARRFARIAATGLALATLPALVWLSRDYVLVWRDSVTLWEYAVRLGGGRAPGVVSGLAQAYLLTGRVEDSAKVYAVGVVLEPGNANAYRNFGLALGHTGRLAEAERQIRTAIGINPRLPKAMFNLAEILMLQDRPGDALAAVTAELTANPHLASARALALRIFTTVPDLDPDIVVAARSALATP